MAFILTLISPLHSQTSSDSLKPEKKTKFFAIPLAFYTPETKFGFGASGIVTFHLASDSIRARPSSIQFGAAYTALKQVLLYLPFQLFYDNIHYISYGELGYYVYNYFFFGVGNQQPQGAREIYDVTYPRLRLHLLKQMVPQLYLGLRYSYDAFSITDTDPNGQLSRGNITGANGGITSGAGLAVRYDSRDNLFYPSKGYYVEFFTQTDNIWTGSDFNFTKYSIDASTYFSTWFHHILALNLYWVSTTGNPPFSQMALIGGTKKMRGYYEGRYRDRDLTMLQAEYRAPLIWRLGAAVFAGCGVVAPGINNYNLNYLRYAYGGGIRVMIDKKQKINVRVDYGIAERKGNFYLTITEAF